MSPEVLIFSDHTRWTAWGAHAGEGAPLWRPLTRKQSAFFTHRTALAGSDLGLTVLIDYSLKMHTYPQRTEGSLEG